MSLLSSLRLAGLCLAGSLSVSFIASATAQTSPAIVAGSLEGKFAVDDSGAATYSIPLSVPPGIAGNEPRLALSYSSQAGNGPLGVGWGLSGLSAITRCGQRLVPHGKIHGVDFSAADRFCLDGQRLVAVSGDYGADGTEYRTEIESYAKVISNGVAGTGPESFTVWSKGGLVLEYGVTDDSRIEAIKADGTARSEARLWALSKQSDRSDNAITYCYTEDQTNGSYRINRIDYGGNVTAGTTATSSVRFIYEDRTDIRTWYQAGTKITQDKRLTNVLTYEAESLVSDYRLSYDNEGTVSNSRITQVQMCDQGNNCLNENDIVFFEKDEGWTWIDTVIGSFGTAQGYRNNTENPLITGDWNGDGKTDFGRVWDLGVSFYVATGTGWQGYAGITGDMGRISYPNDSVYPLVTGDWNGDGRTDVGRVNNTGMSFYISTESGWTAYGALGSAFSPGQGYSNTSLYPIVTGDWNGDGRTDVGRIYSNGMSFFTSNGIGWDGHEAIVGSLGTSQGYSNASVYPIVTGDWNGDGLTDVGRVYSNGMSFFTSNGTGWDGHEAIVGSLGTSQGYSNNSVYPLITGDWNGDGLTDVGRTHSSGMTFFTSTGSEWQSYAEFGSWGPVQHYPDTNVYPLVAGDWNGDGKTDLGRIYSNGMGFITSTGKGWESYPLIIGSWGTTQHYPNNDVYPLVTGDWNGDGLTDLGRIYSNGMSFVTPKKSTPDLMKIVSTSRGHETSITYTPLTDKLVYTKGNSAVYPSQDYVSSLSVVQSVERDDGIGGKRKIEYNYAGARVDLKRGSFLGFKQITSKDVQRGTETITDYRQDWPFVRRTEKSVRQLSDGTPISAQENSWEEVPQTGGSVDVRLKSQTSKQYEINTTAVTP